MIRKACVFVALFVVSLAAYGVEFRFADLKWGSSRAEVQAQLSNRGFTEVTLDAQGDLSFRSAFLGFESRGYAMFVSDELAKVVVHIFVPEPQAREHYGELKEALVQKYGMPTRTFEIRSGKGIFASYWVASAQIFAMEITERLNLRLAYEGPAWRKRSIEAAGNRIRS